jgi:hypothetical protein
MPDLERLLRESAVPARPGESPAAESSWDNRADAIVQRAMSAPRVNDLDAVLAPVSLASEPGEPQSSGGAASSSAAPVIVGVSKMSESDNSQGSSGPVSSRASTAPQSMRARPSLKELAERMSKTPPPSVAPPPSSLSAVRDPGAPPPSTLGARAQQIAAKPATPSAPLASTATPLPVSATPAAKTESAPPPSAAAPSSTAAPASALAPVVPITAAKEKEEKKGGGFGGIAIALVGIAAAAAIFVFLKVDPFKAKPQEEAAKPVETAPAEETKEEPAAKVEEPAPQNDAPPADDGALDIDKLAEASAAPDTPPPPAGGPGPAPVAKNDVEAKDEKPQKVNADGTLEDAMRDQVGADGTKKDDATPASDDASLPKNIPDRPPTGKVTAAVGSVMGGAKACVSGADDVSRANITFGSSGAVKSVSVSGWAAGKPAASCIQSALKGANVGPFSDPSFVFGVTIRP